MIADSLFTSDEPIAAVRAQLSGVGDGLSAFRAFLEHLDRRFGLKTYRLLDSYSEFVGGCKSSGKGDTGRIENSAFVRWV
jgi:hypothetical protein